MRMLLAATLILAALWSGYWYVGSEAKYRAISGWLETQRAQGWKTDYEDFRVVGFPNRFDSQFTNLDFYDPISRIGWKAPLFHILALSYQPNHIIAAFAHQQSLSFPGETVDIKSDEMLASVVFEPDTKLAVQRLRMQTTNFSLVGSLGWQMQAEKFDLATRQNEVVDFAHDVVLDARRVTPTRAFRFGLDPKGKLPETIEKFYLDMVLGFEAPWDRIAIETGAPEIQSIEVNSAAINWGDLGLGATGRFDISVDGIITGRLDLNLRNWREVLDLLVSAGMINQTTAGHLQTGLTILTMATENPNDLKAPLILEGGRMMLGPVQIGYAPRLIRD